MSPPSCLGADHGNRDKVTMPGGAKKFRSVHRYGKKRAKARTRDSDVTLPLPTPPYQQPAADADCVAGDEASPSRLEDSGPLCADSGHVRVDTRSVTTSDITEASAYEQATLESMPATTRKTAPFTEPTGVTAASATECAASYGIVDMDVLNTLLDAVHCKTCDGRVELVRGDRQYGLATKLSVFCENCSEVAAEWSLQRVDRVQACNPLDVNILAGRAMIATGNGQRAMNDIFSAMGLSRRGLHNKTFQRHLKKTFQPAAEAAMTQCAQEVAKVYDDLCFGHMGNIAVCYDGSWMTRGHSSYIAVGAVVELFTGCVLDYAVLSNFCLGRATGPKPNSDDYEAWKSRHQCQKNTSCKAGQMEVEAGKIV